MDITDNSSSVEEIQNSQGRSLLGTCFKTKFTNFVRANIIYIKRNRNVSALFQASEQKYFYTEGRQPKKQTQIENAYTIRDNLHTNKNAHPWYG
jgi:hypothetical protein